MKEDMWDKSDGIC